MREGKKGLNFDVGSYIMELKKEHVLYYTFYGGVGVWDCLLDSEREVLIINVVM